MPLGQGEAIVKRVAELQGNRSVWESHWREIAEVLWPAYSQSFNSVKAVSGDKRTDKMFDSTAPIALSRFGAVMESLLTPRNQTWHRLMPSMPELKKIQRVQNWFGEATRILFAMRYAPKANFASQIHSHWLHLGAFGTGCTFLDGLDNNGFRYKAEHLSKIFIVENHQGVVDQVYRELNLTAEQAVRKFDPNKLSKKIIDAASKRPDTPFTFYHAVMPNYEQDPTRKDFRGMAFKSVYVEKDEKTIVEEGGYRTFPALVSRYVQGPGEEYGRSPGMLALPTMKTLNQQTKTVLKQGQRTVDPVLLAHDQGSLDSFSLKAGALNYGAVNDQGRALVQTLPTGNLSIGHQMIDQSRQVINDVFLVTLFQILADSPTMSATEVLERTREKGILLSPTVGRQQSEFLGPMIERELDLMMQQGKLPEMPGELLEAQGEYDIIYDSPLSRAQRAEEATGLIRTLEMAGAYAERTGDINPYDHLDMDAAMPELMEINAVPSKWRATPEVIQAKRQGRNQQAELQQAVEAMPAAAGLAKAAPELVKG